MRIIGTERARKSVGLPVEGPKTCERLFPKENGKSQLGFKRKGIMIGFKFQKHVRNGE